MWHNHGIHKQKCIPSLILQYCDLYQCINTFLRLIVPKYLPFFLIFVLFCLDSELLLFLVCFVLLREAQIDHTFLNKGTVKKKKKVPPTLHTLKCFVCCVDSYKVVFRTLSESQASRFTEVPPYQMVLSRK